MLFCLTMTSLTWSFVEGRPFGGCACLHCPFISLLIQDYAVSRFVVHRFLCISDCGPFISLLDQYTTFEEPANQSIIENAYWLVNLWNSQDSKHGTKLPLLHPQRRNPNMDPCIFLFSTRLRLVDSSSIQSLPSNHE
jgi:hypothetical protein